MYHNRFFIFRFCILPYLGWQTTTLAIFATILKASAVCKPILVACTCFAAFVAIGQTPPKVNIQAIGPDQGLPNRNTRCVAQDGQGYLWITTGAVLWRYDGYTFQNYTHLISVNNQSVTFITDVQRSPDGSIWVAYNNGINVIDPVRLTSTLKDVSRFYPRQLGGSQIAKIHFVSDGTAWVGFSGNRLVRVTKEVKPLALFESEPARPDKPKGFVVTIVEDKAGRFYLFSNNGDLEVIDKTGRPLRRINAQSDDLQRKGYTPSGEALQGDDKLLVYYNRPDTRASLIRTYSFEKDAFESEIANPYPVRPEITYSSGRFVWYKNEGQVGFVDTATGQFTDLSESLADKTGPRTFFFNACVGSDNTFWLCSSSALFKISITAPLFRQYLSLPLQKPSDVGTSMRGLLEDSAGTIWACSYGYNTNGVTYLLHKLVPNTGSVQHLNYQPRIKASLGPPILYKILFLGGRIYAATDGNALLTIDPKTLRYNMYGFPSITGNEFTFVYNINDTTLWMGCLSGMAMFNTKKRVPVLFNNMEGPYIKNTRVNYFMPWGKGHTLASTSNGLYVLNNDAKILAHYGNALDNIALPSQRIFYTVLAQARLWACSADGLICVDTAAKKTTLFTTGEGLPDNNIYAALPDNRGNLWLSTNNGLSCFNMQSHKVRNYGLADGLPSTEFNNASFLKARDGTLYFGGVNGVVAFDPAQIGYERQKEDSVQLILYSKYTSAGNRTDTVLGNVAAKKIVFNAGDRLFQFSFMSPDYRNTTQNRFRYRLEGFGDNEWHLFETGNKLLFNSLPPGDYTLRVQVSTAGRDWSEKEWSAGIEVNAPWYKTFWAYFFSLLCVTLLVYLFYRNRLKQILRIQQIRNRISADMHDEIGSTLSSITFYSQALLMQQQDEKQKQVIQKIKDNAQQVQEGLSDIIWSVRANLDEIENVFGRMFSFGTELLEPKGIVFHFSRDESLQHRKLTMTQRKNFYLVFKEAVNNAAKYADCATIWVRIAPDAHKTKMEIRDDGKGFDTLNGKQGNGLLNMRERAAQMGGGLTIQSAPGAGTTITLLF